MIGIGVLVVVYFVVEKYGVVVGYLVLINYYIC